MQTVLSVYIQERGQLVVAVATRHREEEVPVARIGQKHQQRKEVNKIFLQFF